MCINEACNTLHTRYTIRTGYTLWWLYIVAHTGWLAKEANFT